MTERDSGPVRVGLVQMRCREHPDENLADALEGSRRAVSEGAEIVCLPELFRTRYFCQKEDHANFRYAERIPGPTTNAFEELAADTDATFVVSLFEKRTDGLYHNTAAVLDGNRGLVGTYRKMHIPDDPQFYEKFYFTPGDLGFRAFETTHARVGTLVCWDQWYPEAARLTTLLGAQILFYPTAIGWLPDEKAESGQSQHQAWELIQRSHAIANGCYVVAVNRVGYEPAPDGGGGIEFWGQSFVAAPNGEILLRLPSDEADVAVVEVDLGRIDAFRTEWPFLRDRRIDVYGDLNRRFID